MSSSASFLVMWLIISASIRPCPDICSAEGKITNRGLDTICLSIRRRPGSNWKCSGSLEFWERRGKCWYWTSGSQPVSCIASVCFLLHPEWFGKCIHVGIPRPVFILSLRAKRAPHMAMVWAESTHPMHRVCCRKNMGSDNWAGIRI